MSAERPRDADVRRTRRSSEQVRALILTAAGELFESEGFAGTSTRTIAHRAGVSPTVLFRHFGSKQELYDHVTGAGVTEPKVRRQIRTEEQTRALLLDAGRELFSAQGYAKTSTRQIAERAGVQEIGLFRYFGTKAALFREAILDPFGTFIERQRTQATSGTHLASPEFLGGLYRVLLEQSNALLALVAARLHEGDDVVAGRDTQAAMDEIIRPLADQLARDCRAAGITGIDVPVATRITIAMIGGTAIFKDWLFTDADAITEEEIVAEMVAYVAAALTRVPRSPAR